MIRRITAVVLSMLALGTVSCAARNGLAPSGPLRKATIEVWRDGDNKCHTHTTPLFGPRKSQERYAEWKINDDTKCLAPESAVVEVKFDKGDSDPISSCVKRGKSRIRCSLSAATEGNYKYSVWLDTEREDPVIIIEP